MRKPGWDTAPLGRVVEILDNRRVPVNAKERATRPGRVPYFGATGQAGWIDRAIFDEELVLLGEDGAPFFQPDRGVAYLIRGPSWVNNHAHVLRAGPRLTNRFLLHQLNQVDYRGFVSGTTRAKLPQGPMREIQLVLPPLPEQELIVSALEAHFSRLDAAVASLTRAKANVANARASVLKAAVEGRLVPTEADLAAACQRTFEPASALLKSIVTRRGLLDDARRRDGARSGVAAGPGQEPWPLPPGWCWVSVEQLCEVGTGATPKRGTARYWASGTVPWVTSTATNSRFVDSAEEYVTEAALEETNLTLYPPRTLLLAMYGEGRTRGRCAVTRFPTTTNQALAALVTTALPRITVEWLRAFMDYNYENIRRLSIGGVQPNLNLGIVRAIRVPLPPLAEQERIVAEVDRRMSVLDEIERAASSGLARSTQMRQAILKHVFEGRLVQAASVNAVAASRPDGPMEVVR